jgi:hypothetical protein
MNCIPRDPAYENGAAPDDGFDNPQGAQLDALRAAIQESVDATDCREVHSLEADRAEINRWAAGL